MKVALRSVGALLAIFGTFMLLTDVHGAMTSSRPSLFSAAGWTNPLFLGIAIGNYLLFIVGGAFLYRGSALAFAFMGIGTLPMVVNQYLWHRFAASDSSLLDLMLLVGADAAVLYRLLIVLACFSLWYLAFGKDPTASELKRCI